MTSIEQSVTVENRRVILYPPGGNFNQLRAQQQFLNDLLEEFHNLPSLCDKLGRNRREYIRDHVMPRIPGGVWVYERDTKAIRRLDRDQAEIKILQKLRDKIKYCKQRNGESPTLPLKIHKENLPKRPLKKRSLSISEPMKAPKKSRDGAASPTSFSKPQTVNGSEQKQQQLQEQLQFLYVLCSDQKRHIDYLKSRVGQLESSRDQKAVGEV